MDGVVDVRFAIAMSKLGGLAVLNLEGVQTRYKNPQEVLQKIVETDKPEITALLQKIYQEPVQEDLIAARIRQIKRCWSARGRQFHSTTRGRIWGYRAGGGGRCFCRAKHGLDRAPHFFRI